MIGIGAVEVGHDGRMTIVRSIDRFMATHQWNHNSHYHRWIRRQLPSTRSRALDVGCGTGDLARLLARRVGVVEGIDVDPAMIDAARRVGTPPGCTFTLGSLHDLPPGRRYDAITAVAVLHHMPFADALGRLVDMLVPDGTLLVVGCYRETSAVDRAVSLAAVPTNVAMGLYKGRAQPPLSMTAPTASPAMTLPEIRRVAGELLPGYRLRRALFWRYLLRYTAP